MKRRTRKSTLTDPLFPCPTRFRSSSDAARRGDVGGGLCRIREERKAPFHFRRRLQSPVHETLAFEAERIDRSLLADRGQHILQRQPLGGVVEDVAHRHASNTSASAQRGERRQPCEVAGPAAGGQRERRETGRASGRERGGT